MLKLLTLISLFICFVYTNDQHNESISLSPSEFQLEKKQLEENKNNFQTIKGQYTEEKKSSKLCKEKNHRRLGDKDNKDADLVKSLPLTATTEQISTANIGNKFITSSIHGANYNYNYEKSDKESGSNNLQSKNCDCDDCVVEENKKVLQFESLTLGVNDNPIHNAVTNTKDFESDLTDSFNSSFNNAELNETASDEPDDGRRSNAQLDSDINQRAKPCNKTFNLNTRRRKCGKIDSSQKLSITRRILPGMENPSNIESKDNNLYQDSPQINNDDEIDNRQHYYPNVNKVTNSYDIDLVHNMNINEVPQKGIISQDSVESQLMEPTRGKGIYDMKDTGIMLLENSRVCYACSTISDPTCWAPNKRTTVKYCRKGHHSCLTKSFKHKGESVIIRDCGSHCVNLSSSDENYSSCSICHSDLCNGATKMSIYGTSVIIIAFLGMSINTR